MLRPDDSKPPKTGVTPTVLPGCKICGGATRHVFDLPAMKTTAGPMVPPDDDGRLAHFYECNVCRFLFSDIKDADEGFYETAFTGIAYTPEPGSEIQYMRLLYLAAELIGKPLHLCEIVDFGCGIGHFVTSARDYLQLQIFGYDLAQGVTDAPYIFSTPPDRRFDIVVAREVVEHFTDPRESFAAMKRLLKPGGALAFQTGLYTPGTLDRSWGYIGPKNGHISLYSNGAFEQLATQLGVSQRLCWNGYAGIQAWGFTGDASGPAMPAALVIPASDLRPTELAARDGDALTDAQADRAGTIITGPRRMLPAGRYRIELHGRIDGRYRLNLSGAGGQITWATGTVSAGTPTIDVELFRRCHDFECIIRRLPDSRGMRLEKLVVRRLGEPWGGEHATGWALFMRVVRQTVMMVRYLLRST